MKKSLIGASVAKALASIGVAQREGLTVDDGRRLVDTLVPGYIPTFEVFNGPWHDGDIFEVMTAEALLRPKSRLPRYDGSYIGLDRSGGQQKNRDVAVGRAAEKRARKARAVTRRSRK